MNPSDYKIKTAIISVSDKTGVVDFAKKLASLGIDIYSTGGTAKILKEASIEVKSISQLTGFPEILGGRVKTLHPAVHAGLLADLSNEEHVRQLSENNLKSIDLLVVNLYPFEQTLNKENVTHEELIENIDIGGPAMLRASAKNYRWTAVVVNPDRYSEIIAYLKAGQSIPEDYRLKLAGEVFSHTAYYDSLIAKYFNQYNQIEIPEKINLSFNLSQTLRYGENPHQKAALYGYFNCIFEKLHGKELSFNNIIDISAATELISEFDELALAIIKHTNPCGVALGNTIAEAFEKALTTDNVSPFGGIIAVNRKIDSDAANAIHSMFTEVIIAPDFTDDALELLMKKKDRRLIKVNFELLEKHFDKNIRSVPGGLLVQDSDNLLLDESNLQVVTKRKPTDDELQSMKFAWKVCKHVKSNAIVYAKSDRTLAIGAGQMSRVDSSRIAVEKAKLQSIDLTGSAIASDAFFPFDDGVRYAASAGATAVIQPGGSVRDEEVIKSADELNLTMIFTGIRHFRH